MEILFFRIDLHLKANYLCRMEFPDLAEAKEKITDLFSDEKEFFGLFEGRVVGQANADLEAAPLLLLRLDPFQATEADHRGRRLGTIIASSLGNSYET